MKKAGRKEQKINLTDLLLPRQILKTSMESLFFILRRPFHSNAIFEIQQKLTAHSPDEQIVALDQLTFVLRN